VFLVSTSRAALSVQAHGLFDVIDTEAFERVSQGRPLSAADEHIVRLMTKDLNGVEDGIFEPAK
jgi:hypothetical protein